MARSEAAISGCGFKLLGQFDADKVENWLKQHRDESKITKTRAADATKPKPFGIVPSHHHLGAVKSFGNWLVKARRLERNPFAHLSKSMARSMSVSSGERWNPRNSLG